MSAGTSGNTSKVVQGLSATRNMRGPLRHDRSDLLIAWGAKGTICSQSSLSLAQVCCVLVSLDAIAIANAEFYIRQRDRLELR